MTILINGIAETSLDVRDRGLQFGDGVFETLRLHHGHPQLWPRHWQRLCRGLDGLRIPRIREQACLDDLARVAQGPWALAKLIVTRGPGPRGYAVPTSCTPTRVVMGGEAFIPEAGGTLRLGLCRTRTVGNPLPGCKHLNRIENVLARMEWGSDWDEGLMLDAQDGVRCGTQGNVFILEGSKLLTPPVQAFGVAGTRRGWLLEQGARIGLQIETTDLPLSRVQAADAVYISNSRIGLQPACWVDRASPQVGANQGTGLKQTRPKETGPMAVMLQLGLEINALD